MYYNTVLKYGDRSLQIFNGNEIQTDKHGSSGKKTTSKWKSICRITKSAETFKTWNPNKPKTKPKPDE